MKPIVIEYYELEDGGLCVFPPQSRIDAEVKRLRSEEDRVHNVLAPKGKGKPELVPERTSDRYAAMMREARDIAGDNIKRFEFPYRSYTYGERLEARRQATTFYTDDSGNEKFKWDQDEYEAALLSLATGKTRDELYGLPPAIYETLSAEVFARSAIPPEKLSFFAT